MFEAADRMPIFDWHCHLSPKEIYENYDYLDKTRKMFFDVFDKLIERGEKILLVNAFGSVEEIAEKILDATLELLGEK